MNDPEELEVLDVLLGVIIADNRTFKGTPPPVSKRRRHVQRYFRLYKKLMASRSTRKPAQAVETTGA